NSAARCRAVEITSVCAAENKYETTVWCRGRDSNPRPPHYECGALPAELPRHTAEITRDNLFRQPLVAANCYGIATIWAGAPLLYRLLQAFVNAARGIGCGSGETKQSSQRLKGGRLGR